MSTDPVELEMLKARVRLLMEQPLFGQMILHLDMQAAGDWCATAATDGRKFYYNREFIKSLTLDELVFLYGHEILHVILDHIFRRGDRDKAYWGMACDYIANFILKESNIGQMPKGGLYNENYSDAFSAEELYALLERNAVKIKQPLDVHLETNDDKSGDPTDGTAMPVLDPSEIEEIREMVRTALAQAAHNTDPGDIPAGINRLLDRLRKPKINWRQMLVSMLRSTIKFDYTYRRVSRRSWSSGLILPGQDVTEKADVVCAIDASGSITDEMIRVFLSEVAGIMSSFMDYSVMILSFDVKVHHVEIFTPKNAREIQNYKIMGGGGTRPSCVWTYMKEHKIKPHKIVMFTDGAVGNDWGDETYAETLFIIHSNPGIMPPYGKCSHYSS